jgi:PAS domain S-box-containing protein
MPLRAERTASIAESGSPTEWEAGLEAGRARAMVDSALDALVAIDQDGNVVEFNAAAERTFGHDRLAAIGKPMVELLIPPERREAHLVGLRHFLATGEGPVLGKRIEVAALHADGSEFPVEMSIVKLDLSGPPIFAAYLRDISERALRDAALQESASIIDSSFDAIVSRTPDGVVTSWNGAAERIFGYRPHEILGRSINLLEPPERTGELEWVNERLRRFGRLEPFETVRLRNDGARVDVETTVSPIVDAFGELIAVSAISRDISERKRSETLSLGQARLLALVAEGTPLTELLDLVARFVEEQSSDVLTSILLLDVDGVHLRDGAAPSLPADYREAIDGVAIGPSVGSCGTAAYRREQVVVSDIALVCGRVGQRPSSRPTARCSAPSRCTTAKLAAPTRTISSSSRRRCMSSASRSSARWPNRRCVRARSGTTIFSRTRTSRSRPCHSTMRSPR